MKVCKFGGTSMANAAAIKRVINIINSSDDRRIIVVSAPGKRNAADTKITDALLKYHDRLAKGVDDGFQTIEKRFADIASGLGIKADFSLTLNDVKRQIKEENSRDFTASRGEYLAAILLAQKLGARFLDAKDVICFNKDGELSLNESVRRIRSAISDGERVVMPGFYGAYPDGKVKSFSRGGSDITGAVVASALPCELYENWSDVNGFLTADPRIVRDPKTIDVLSYRELRELAYMGAQVIHPDAIYPVRSAGIPINIKNTFDPSSPGTMIVADDKLKKTDRIITGIAGRTGFTIINIEKEMMNRQIGFGRKVLSVLEDENVSFEHIPSGIDTLSIVICDENIGDKLQRITDKIREATRADSVEIHRGMSLIATVGHNMASRQGTAAVLFDALAEKHINVRMIDQGSSELNIIIGVDTFDYEKAIRAIYRGFIA